MSYEIPKSLTTRLIAVGGLNRFREPNFRVVWGPTRMTIIGGEWAIMDNSGNVTGHVTEERCVPKYYPAERFYIEKWMPPEHYGTRDEWELNQIETVDGIRIPNLGPYPSRGEYELSMRLSNHGEFAPILGAEDAIVDLVRMIKAGEAVSHTENWLAIQRAQEKQEREYDCFADAVLDDTNDFEGKPHIYLPNLPKPKRLTARELKTIRYRDMGARVERPQEITA